MKLVIAGICICALSFSTLAGIGHGIADSTNRWSVGVIVVPGLAYQTLSITQDSETTERIVAQRNDLEDARVNLTGNLALGYRLSSLFSLEAGVGYALLGWRENMDLSGLTFGDIIDPRRGFIYQTDAAVPTSIRIVDSFHYIEVPIRASLHLGHGRVRSVTSIEVSTAFLIRSTSTSYSEYADGHSERRVADQTDAFNKVALFPTISSGVSFDLSDRLEMRVEPSFRYGVLRIIDAPVTANLWSAGLGIDVRLML